MGNRKITRDLKLAAIRFHEQGILTTHEILECIGFSKRTFRRVLKLYRETGDVGPKPRSEYAGRPRSLNVTDLFGVRAVRTCKRETQTNERKSIL
ncbi:hypothetical protein BKA83DRAFT_4043984 [Pisolithus microcarpus]|nr:hypothetical protein BKA83DRAFT_4043984 [Pisolithus microcarpus]